MSALGRPYQFAAAGPYAFDCSGLTMWAWAHAGVSLPHTAAGQMASVRRVSMSALMPGDLIFMGYGYIHHVGIYVGGGMIIHAPHSGTVVKLDPLSYFGDIAGAGRP